MTSRLFTPLALRAVELSNRIVVSPMCQYMAEDGSANDWHLMHLGQFAMGAAALVMTEATHVSRAGRISHRCLGLYRDDNEVQLKRVVDFCRRYGVARLGIQLAHAGRKGSAHTPAEGGKPLRPEEDAWTTLAPSALPFGPGWHVPEALTRDGLREVKRQFVDAARRAARIGFDVAELHAGHGYLLHEFLSPISNHRDDEYGGSTAGRIRFPLEVFEAVRGLWPQDRPLGVRVSATDWIEGGWTPEETVIFARELKALGCDFLDVTSGQLDPRQQIAFAPGYNVPFAERVRKETGMTVMAVGMITRPKQAEEIVSGGRADLVAIARGMMDDPRWAWHAARELGAETAYAPNYMRCHPSVWKP
ncbi:MAG TPA: NADH:flavin oxidoreductase/NADH oxidase [Burkholderiales bacterium]|jgi:2,4-dienoyl-CoA reductase-like NADH-dependent reductase (Old Yellow Enzyme family)|nr:NADH:flavin oxidoreductase/NADH oxidase [Burkholderiales bacterium]